MSRFRSTRNHQPKSSTVQSLVFKKSDTFCNLCAQKRNLSYDHIPPQCCGNDKAVVARRIYAEKLIARQVDSKSNNGLKWKTLCRQCNGDIVGCWDPALGEFTKRAEVLLSRSVMLPKCVALKIRGGAVLRSILGHVVAAKTQGDKVPMDAKIRDFLLGRTTLHPAVQVFCWLYPFPPIIVARDFSWVEVVGEGGGSPGLATVVKFFPLAILVLDANEKGTLETKYMTPIHPFASMGDEDEAEIEMWRDPIFHPGWPERAMGNHVVIGGRSYGDSVTTVAEGGAFVTPGKQIEAVSWAQGDAANLPDGLHAFAEVPGERTTRT